MISKGIVFWIDISIYHYSRIINKKEEVARIALTYKEGVKAILVKF